MLNPIQTPLDCPVMSLLIFLIWLAFSFGSVFFLDYIYIICIWFESKYVTIAAERNVVHQNYFNASKAFTAVTWGVYVVLNLLIDIIEIRRPLIAGTQVLFIAEVLVDIDTNSLDFSKFHSPIRWGLIERCIVKIFSCTRKNGSDKIPGGKPIGSDIFQNGSDIIWYLTPISSPGVDLCNAK